MIQATKTTNDLRRSYVLASLRTAHAQPLLTNPYIMKRALTMSTLITYKMYCGMTILAEEYIHTHVGTTKQYLVETAKIFQLEHQG